MLNELTDKKYGKTGIDRKRNLTISTNLNINVANYNGENQLRWFSYISKVEHCKIDQGKFRRNALRRCSESEK